MSSKSSLMSGSFWGILSKVVSSVVRLFSIPLLVAFFGKVDFGLFSLAFSLNAYLRLMDLGLSMGAVRFFSIWISEGKGDKIKNVANSSIMFYGVIGLINAIVFVVFAFFPKQLFNLKPEQADTFFWMMIILAFSSFVNWLSNVVNQLLTAYGEFSWINKVMIISSILEISFTLFVIKFHYPLLTYFVLYILSTIVCIPLNVYQLRHHLKNVFSYFKPKWYALDFKEVFSYSMTIFAMALFQFSANNLRPLFLAKFSNTGVAVLTEYRVIETVNTFIIMFAGVFTQVLLPIMSKLYAAKNTDAINKIIYVGTKYISIFLSFFIFIIVINSKEILFVYMGKDFTQLSIWLSFSLLSLLTLHTSPISSFILSVGNTKPIAVMSAIGCVVSLPVTIILAPLYGVGAAIVGYFVYQLMQILFYYLYYNPKILFLNSWSIFSKSFLPALFLGVVSSALTYGIKLFLIFDNKFLNLIVPALFFSIFFFSLMFLFVVKPKEILAIVKNKGFA